jgi:ribosomal protein S18 acetylase RimI-like enzyme
VAGWGIGRSGREEEVWMAEVRAVTDEDHAELRRLFVRASEGAPTADLWGHQESQAAVYLEPYLRHEPESLLVAEENGALVGYLTGCVDSARFPSESERMDEAIRNHRLMLRPRPVAFFARSVLDVAVAKVGRRPTAQECRDPRWPAHLHINVEPKARGTGVADGLMSRWLDRLRQVGSPGCHLQTVCENTRAVRFFERMGFVGHGPTPLVPGLRHRGRRVHQKTMVWTP